MADPHRRSTRPDSVTTVQSHTNWSIVVGDRRLSLSRTRVTRSVGGGSALSPMQPPRRRAFWPLATGTFASVSAFGLVMAGALATPRPGASRLALPLPAPALRPATAAPVDRLIENRRTAIVPGRRRPAIGAGGEAGLYAGAAAPLAIAMRTGAFQEWTDGAGGHYYLTVGPLHAEGGRQCRNVALLLRAFGGADRVGASRRCLPAGQGDAVPVDAPAVQALGDAAATADPAASLLLTDRH